jgi:hypothetical protein
MLHVLCVHLTYMSQDVVVHSTQIKEVEKLIPTDTHRLPAKPPL